MTYSQTVEYLFSLEFFGIKMGLENITRLCRELGNPQERFDCIHIAGTNGKGSTSAMIASVLRSSGYSTGLYTSPHLIDFRERIQTGGEPLPEAFVRNFTERIRPLALELKATFFEVTTAMTFSFFAEQKIDVAVVETGMGGRLDATNIVQPLLSVITPIGLDHMQYLGDTVEKIAGEKAGILKHRIPVVIAAMDEKPSQVIRQSAQEKDSPVYDAEKYVLIQEAQPEKNGMRVRVNMACMEKEFWIPLAGQHQVGNVQTALTAVSVISACGYPVSDAAVREGLAAVRWPCRFEILPGTPPMVLDASHNPQGVKTITQTFPVYFPGRTPLFVIGLMKDKDCRGFLDVLAPLNGRFIFATPHIDRAARGEELAAMVLTGRSEYAATVALALDRARESVRSQEVIVVTGSFHTIGEAMEHLGRKVFA